MKNKICLILCIATSIFLFFWSCEDTTSSENPVPGKVQLVNKSPEDDAVETGIDAEYILGSQPPRDGIKIQWHPVQDNDLVGYRVYRSTVDSSTALSRIATVRSQSAGRIDTSYFDTDTSLVAHTRYYYRISAEDGDQEGPRSRADYYTLEEACNPTLPNISTNFDGTFEWESPTGHTGNFILRISKFTLESVKITELHNWYTHQANLIQLGIDSLEAGTYRWRIDMIGSEENNGSESAWLDFVVQ